MAIKSASHSQFNKGKMPGSIRHVPGIAGIGKMEILTDPIAKSALADARSKINEIDLQFISLLAERLKIMKDVAAAKKESGLPISDRKREKEVTARFCKIAAKAGVEKEYAEKLIKAIIAICIDGQKKL